MSPAIAIPFAETSSTWPRNLDALTETQPELAERLRSVERPAGAVLTTGRDGAPTFRITDESGHARWFGDSSMPAISAEEVLAQFTGCAGNAALPGILTGVEPFVVLDKLPKWAAVFVVEEDPAEVRLAFELRDYSSAIRDRRLFLLLGPDPVAETEKLFSRHPGLLMPETLLTVPQRSAARIAELQKALESAARAAASVQANLTARALERLRADFANRPENPPPRNSGQDRSGAAGHTAPAMSRSFWDPVASDRGQFAKVRIAVISSDVGTETLALTRRLERAADKLACSHATCVPDRPDRCHLAARVQTMAHPAPDVVFVLNGHPRNLRPLLPKSLPIVSIFTGDAPSDSTAQPELTQFDRIILAAEDDRRITSDAPGESLRVSYGSLAAIDQAESSPAGPTFLVDLGTQRPQTGRHSGDGRAPGSPSVAIVGHLPDAHPESLDITLHSHLALWDALRRVIRTQIDQLLAVVPLDDDRLETMLASAEKDCGMYLKDAGLRSQFMTLVGQCLVPSIRGIALAETAVAAGCGVVVLGENWPEGTDGFEQVSPTLVAPPGDCRAAVLLDLNPPSVQFALDAMHAGCLLISTSSSGQFERKYPYLADLTPGLQFAATRGELLRILRGLRENDPKISAVAAEGRDRVRSGHSMSHRLCYWLELFWPSPA